MIRLRNAVLAAVAGLLATGALAQSFTQDREAVTVAEELFGTDAVKLEFNPFGDEDGFVPKAKLIFGGSTLIGTDTEFNVTYTLSNATFAERASVNDFMWGSWGPASDARGGLDCHGAGTDATLAGNADENLMMRSFCTSFSPNDGVRAGNTVTVSDEVTVTIEDGGARGDNSVTYKVKVKADVGNATPGTCSETTHTTEAACLGATPPETWTAAVPAGLFMPATYGTAMNYAGTTRKIVWAVPDVNASGLYRAIPTYAPLKYGNDVTVSTSIERATSEGTAISEMLMDGNMCGARSSDDEDAVVPCTIVNAVNMIDVTADDGDAGRISLNPDHGRAVLVKSNGSPEDVQRVKVGSVTVSTTGFGEVRDAEGNVIDDFNGVLSGSLAITVASEGLRDGDVVYIDVNDNKEADGREAFEIDGAMALDTIALELDEGSSMMERDVYYAPNGKDPMKHRTNFTTSAATEFSDTNHVVRSTSDTRGEQPGKAQLGLVGIKPNTAKAYAIAPLDSTDTANVRVTCESSAPAGCNVFLDCRDEAGTNTFGEAGATIGPNMTVRWTQMEIADALDLDEGWERRLACEVLSSAEITVQVLTRASGVLVNNTATDSGGT